MAESSITAPSRTPPETSDEPGLRPRVLARVGEAPASGLLPRAAAGETRGPLLVVVAGMHGNEPGGVEAVEAVGRALEARAAEQEAPVLRGEMVALCGNRPALAAGVRYLGEDLNRLWTPARVSQLREGGDPPAAGEDREQWELLRMLDALLVERPDAVVLDLHSTSGPGAPFACISDTLRARSLALALPIPLILGIEEAVAGTLLDHMESEGQPMLLVEGGQHDDPETAGNLEAVLWLVLHELGMLPEPMAVDLRQCRARLERAALGLPRVLEVVHRHEIDPDEEFRMNPGHRNFEPVGRGQALAGSRYGPVRSPERGLLLMPLYQPQGADGFFVGRQVRRSWLQVSTWMRALRMDRLLYRLPGVTPDAVLARRVEVDPAVARWGTTQLFHLAGFRRLPDRSGRLRFSRRPEP